jgi:hypothetical protein
MQTINVSKQHSSSWTRRCPSCGTVYSPYQDGRRIVAVTCCGQALVMHHINGNTSRTSDAYVTDVARKSRYADRWDESRQVAMSGSEPKALSMARFPLQERVVVRTYHPAKTLRVRTGNRTGITTKHAG